MVDKDLYHCLTQELRPELHKHLLVSSNYSYKVTTFFFNLDLWLCRRRRAGRRGVNVRGELVRVHGRLGIHGTMGTGREVAEEGRGRGVR